MNEETGTRNGAAMDDGLDLGLHDASAILQEAGERAQRGLRINRPVIFASAGLAWFLGYGAVWLSVRGQHPYHGPTPGAAAAQILLVLTAVAITAAMVSRAASGVGGASPRRRAITSLSLLAGYIAVVTLEAALDHARAGRPVVFGIVAAAAPILVTGLIYMASSAATLDWMLFGLGLWLVILAVGSTFASPVTVWAVEALAGAPAYLLIAAIRVRRA